MHNYYSKGEINMKKYLRLMRVQHYLKNVLILFPLVFSGNLFNINFLLTAILGVVSFSLMSSSIYILNDICDREKDKLHPKKCKRPIASGEISVQKASLIFAILIIVSLGINIYINVNTVLSILILVSYFTINVLYSIKLKNIPIVDVTILVLGFLLRVIYGGVILNIFISNWLYLAIISVSFYMGFGKRRNELKQNGDKTRKVLKYYNEKFLDKNMYMCLSLMIVFYSLWCIDPLTVARYNTNALIFTIPIVMLICMKYSLIIESDSDGDPIEVILSDKIIMFMGAIYVIMMIVIMYYSKILHIIN